MPKAMPEALSRIADSGLIGPEDVLAIRRIVYGDGQISADEAAWLLDLNHSAREYGEEWRALFIEALTDYTVHQLAPQGYVSPENVDWLIARIIHDGVIASDTELELLINVLEKAISAPGELAVFALREVKALVLRRNRISEREVTLLRRVLYAAGGHEGIAITREEAEVLLDIDHMRGGSEDDPAWVDLFAKAILNHIMFASGFSPPTREEALRREAWLNDTSVDPGRFMKNMVVSLREIVNAYRAPDVMEDYVRQRTERQVAAESITDVEALWLAERLLRDGRLSLGEQALVEALRAEHPKLHPAINAALTRMG
ncbi:MAG: hypothetical protein IOC86_09115 [Aestuariivirga sp.]|nr:hypothetical protein [Aestuariivirga sp.]